MSQNDVDVNGWHGRRRRKINNVDVNVVDDDDVVKSIMSTITCLLLLTRVGESVGLLFAECKHRSLEVCFRCRKTRSFDYNQLLEWDHDLLLFWPVFRFDRVPLELFEYFRDHTTESVDAIVSLIWKCKNSFRLYKKNIDQSILSQLYYILHTS